MDLLDFDEILYTINGIFDVMYLVICSNNKAIF